MAAFTLLFSPDENEARMKEEAAGDEGDDSDGNQDSDDDEGAITEFRFVPSDKAARKSEHLPHHHLPDWSCSISCCAIGHSAVCWPESQRRGVFSPQWSPCSRPCVSVRLCTPTPKTTTQTATLKERSTTLRRRVRTTVK